MKCYTLFSLNYLKAYRMQSPLELSEIVTVKVCHDLAGPIGAMNNGAELLKDKASNGHVKEESLNLVEISAQEAVYKLMYFRQCYGTPSFDGEHNIEALRDMTLNYFQRSKITIDWQLPKPTFGTNVIPTVTTVAAKAVLNSILVVASSLVYGGTVKIWIARDFQKILFSVRGEGQLVKLSQDVLDPFTRPIETLSASIKNLNAFLAATFLHQAGRKFSFTHNEQSVELSVTA